MEVGKFSQQLTSEIKDLLSKFEISIGNITGLEIISNGRINRSFSVTMHDDNGFVSYILQRINTNVFKKPKELMNNISRVTEHITQKGKETIHFKKVKEKFRNVGYGEYIYSDNGACWRLMDFIESDVKNQISGASDLTSLGEAIGDFAQALSDFDASCLVETIPNFHNTSARLGKMVNRITAICFGPDAFLQTRCRDCKEEIEFIISPKRTEKVGVITDAIRLGAIPVRVSHNDPKLNNVLFDRYTGKAKCMIDLDTVMPGTILYDFGDAVRYACNTESEESNNPQKVRINLEYFKAFCEGFISSTSLTEREANLLVDSVWLMTYELAIRFLDDHIDCNKYFGVDSDGDNLRRARVQIALLKDIEKNEREMRQIVSDIHFERG